MEYFFKFRKFYVLPSRSLMLLRKFQAYSRHGKVKYKIQGFPDIVGILWTIRDHSSLMVWGGRGLAASGGWKLLNVPAIFINISTCVIFSEKYKNKISYFDLLWHQTYPFPHSIPGLSCRNQGKKFMKLSGTGRPLSSCTSQWSLHIVLFGSSTENIQQVQFNSIQYFYFTWISHTIT